MPHINTPQSIYNKLIDVTNYSKTNNVLNRIKKLDQKERALALRIIKNPNTPQQDQKTLDSIRKKLFTEILHRKKSFCEKIKAIFGNLFGKRIASRKLINPLVKAQKIPVPQTEPVTIQPTPPTIKKPSKDELFINRLENGSPVQRKKAYLYGNAKRLFEQGKCPNNLVTHQKVYNKPDWLAQPFKPEPINFQTQDGFYDYKPVGNKTNIWVDFSNAYFGGGAGEGGFVQEEIMLVEFYDLFKHFATHEDSEREFWCNIDTRVGNRRDRNQVGKADPAPVLIQNAHRVQQVAPDLYGSTNVVDKNSNKVIRWGIADIPMDELEKKVIKLDQSQEANILAIAAPKLSSKNPQEQFHPETLKDIFNQLMAGFSLAKEKEPNLLIHSGPFGCGAFNNSSKAVWFLHLLAASQLGIDTTLHAYPKDYANGWNQISRQFIEQNGQPKTLENCINILSNYLIANPN